MAVTNFTYLLTSNLSKTLSNCFLKINKHKYLTRNVFNTKVKYFIGKLINTKKDTFTMKIWN